MSKTFKGKVKAAWDDPMVLYGAFVVLTVAVLAMAAIPVLNEKGMVRFFIGSYLAGLISVSLVVSARMLYKGGIDAGLWSGFGKRKAESLGLEQVREWEAAMQIGVDCPHCGKGISPGQLVAGMREVNAVLLRAGWTWRMDEDLGDMCWHKPDGTPAWKAEKIGS